MKRLSAGFLINFSKLVNNSFVVNHVVDDQTKLALSNPNLPEIVKISMRSYLDEGPKLLTGKNALYASLGYFNLIPSVEDDSLIEPINAKYAFDTFNPEFQQILNRLDVESANFVLSYVQWRTKESLTDKDWSAFKVINGINALDKINFIIEQSSH